MHLGARTIPVEYFILRVAAPLPGVASTIAGYLAERPILTAVQDSAGTCYRYAGLAPRLPDGRYDVQSLSAGEWIVEPGLIYRSEDL